MCLLVHIQYTSKSYRSINSTCTNWSNAKTCPHAYGFFMNGAIYMGKAHRTPHKMAKLCWKWHAWLRVDHKEFHQKQRIVGFKILQKFRCRPQFDRFYRVHPNRWTPIDWMCNELYHNKRYHFIHIERVCSLYTIQQHIMAFIGDDGSRW